jgi:hypothetical protein
VPSPVIPSFCTLLVPRQLHKQAVLLLLLALPWRHAMTRLLHAALTVCCAGRAA